ncbi:sigma factor-like helix-turn-helix DNA-binding protein [Lacimicrobium alkaliphilum]|uniref:RNA polymerase sigma-70 region 4 domain-containing protein n=1 Tax=Lacimicrobium alkaliphilum TaxID=1526571 RepID=A0ABQ1RUF6_9ALTE|nr:sigma factor-like helix-turn-helix DNA-binding protein [Lacimicrobium alkaliphilum]GGD79346.1 hypothetical protein GCM10011357_37940 [Lacimicrobium alkaliphilum]
MTDKNEDFEVSINVEQLTAASYKLLNSLLEMDELQLRNSSSFWDVIDQLDTVSFNTIKTNVYFADLLRAILFTRSKRKEAVMDFLPKSTRDTENKSVRCDSILSHNFGNEIQHDSKKGTLSLPPLNTNLDMLDLPPKFIKLIKRLKNVSDSPVPFSLGENLKDLLSLPVHTIENLPGVGAWYVYTFRELKTLANQYQSEDSISNYAEPNNKLDLSSIDLNNMRVSLISLDDRLLKPFEKYARFHNLDDIETSIVHILSFNRGELSSLSGFGRRAVDGLMELKNLVENELQLISNGEINYKNFESKLIVPKCISSLSLEQLEQLLLDDIDMFLDSQSDDEVDITQRRWGYVEDKETLEDIGQSYGLSRERIRQKAAKSNKIFLSYLRISPETIWDLIEPELDSRFPEKWEDLFSCFSSEKDFYEFLEIICKQDNLFNYVNPEIDKSIFNTYFSENGAPALIEDLKDYLATLELPNVRNLSNAIHYLATQGILSIEGELAWPRLLNKSEASACVLVNYPKGLPWLDIAKLVNSQSISRSDIYEDRLNHEAFKHPDYIYLSGKGIYKHTNFMNSGEINVDEIFFELKKFAESSDRGVFHLNECYSASDVLKCIGYYEIRHFVKHFGEDYGVYFDGLSQADSVSLKKDFKKITQEDVIIEALNKREKPYTKPEVAGLLKSKSLGHAAFLLDRLIEDGRIVQFDRMLYTTPDKAYRSIDVKAYVDALLDVMIKYGKPVEPSVFKEELNERFSKSYSKYFYASIARLYSNTQGWERKHSLYSINKIPYRNLKDVIQKVCSLNLSTIENIDALQKHVAITNETASIAITSWRNQPTV